LLRRAGYTWRRVRRSLRQKRDQRAFERAHEELLALHAAEQRRELDLYYVDESGFSLTPEVPYAWQKSGESLSCLSNSNGKRQTVLGFLSCLGGFRSYVIEGYGTSELIVACIDQFVGCQKRRRRPVVLVLDNASLHTSALFRSRLSRWAEAGVTVKYLPQYSPELNMIEILWKRIKYSWLPLDAYESWENLTDSLTHILSNIGREYQITFS
jgi:transposase